MVESFGGFGATRAEAVADAVQNFVVNSFHVILAALFGTGDDQITIETWTIGGRERRVFIGNMAMRGTAAEPSNPPIGWFKDFEAMVKNEELSPGTHWIRIYYAQLDHQLTELEVLLDNDPWQSLRARLTSLDWPIGPGFFSLRIFLIIKDI
jgi:hypothetical protein